MTMSDISPRVKPESLGIGAVVAATEILGVPCVRLAERTGADLAEVSASFPGLTTRQLC